MLTDAQYKLRYSELRKKNLMKKALILQNNFRELFLHKTEREQLNMLSQCGHYHYNMKSKPLTEECKIMYEYLVTHNYNPYTVYKWFLSFMTEELLQEDIINNRLSQEKARKIIVNRKKTEEISKSWNFMEQSRKTAWELLNYE